MKTVDGAFWTWASKWALAHQNAMRFNEACPKFNVHHCTCILTSSKLFDNYFTISSVLTRAVWLNSFEPRGILNLPWQRCRKPCWTQGESLSQKRCSRQGDTVDKWSIKRSRKLWDALIAPKTPRGKIQIIFQIVASHDSTSFWVWPSGFNGFTKFLAWITTYILHGNSLLHLATLLVGNNSRAIPHGPQSMEAVSKH